MKISSTTEAAAFTPIKFEITCETLDELRMLWAITNSPDASLKNNAAGNPNILEAVNTCTAATENIGSQLFRVVNSAIIEAHGKN